MKAFRYPIKTNKRVEMQVIDDMVTRAIDESGVSDGIAVVFTPHTTAGITINENADPDVVRDMIQEINKVIPFDDDYQHMEGNSAAHIKSSLFSPSLTLIIQDGRPIFGTWQSLYFCEFDGPRTRTVYVKIISD